MMFPGKKFLIISIAVLAVGGIVFAATRDKKITYETEAVTRGAVIQEVTVTGSVAPFEKIELQPETSGKVVRVLVTEGAEVKAGDLLLQLDARDINARIASQRAAVDSARARLAELVAGATPQQLALAEAAVATAESKRAAAVSAAADAKAAYDISLSKAAASLDAKLDKFLLDYSAALTEAQDAMDRLTSAMFTADGFLTFSTTSSIAESDALASRMTAEAALAELSVRVSAVTAAGTVSAALAAHAGIVADLSVIKTHLEDCRTVLGSASGLSSTTLATYQSNVSSALASLDASLQTLSTDRSAVELQVQLNDADIASAKAAQSAAAFAVDAAEKALAQATADLAVTQSGSRSEVIAAQRATVAAQEGTLAGLLADLAKRSIFAPLDATVTEVTVSVGETAQPGTAAVVLNAHGTFEIVANVSEVDIARVALGQPVRITLDAFPVSETWTGKVAFIDPAEKVVEGVIFYETKFAFDQEDPRIRSGMTANLAIEVARRDDAVRVPIRALKERDGKTYVDLLVNGATQEIEIVVGIEDDEYAEAVSGLAAGDVVVTGSSEEK